MQRILDHGNEYYQCASHLHLRGLSQVLKETAAAVAAVKAEGRTFDDLLAHMEKEFGQKPDLEKDPFLVAVQKMWTE